MESAPETSLTVPLITRVPAFELWWERMMGLVRVHATGGGGMLPGAWETGATLSWMFHQLVQLHRPEEQALSPRQRIHELLGEVATDAASPPPTVESMARRAGMGLTAFRAHFKEALGEPPKAWLERTRMEQAARLLLTGSHSVQAIAAMIGYDDPYHFSRVFRRQFGASPRHWRQSRIQHGKTG